VYLPLSSANEGMAKASAATISARRQVFAVKCEETAVMVGISVMMG
jgi:hypothetical protein